MDEKGRALQGRLDFCERNVKGLQNGVKGLIKNHQGESIDGVCALRWPLNRFGFDSPLLCSCL